MNRKLNILFIVATLFFVLVTVVLSQQSRIGGRANLGGEANINTQPITIFVNDTFTDTNDTLLSDHTGETGATWTQHSGATGAIIIRSNRAHKDNTSNSSLYYASGLPSGVNYTVEAEEIDITAEGRSSRICGWIDTATITAICIGRINTTTLEFGKFINGTFTQLDTLTISFSTNQPRILKLTRSGTNFEWFVDNVSQGVTAITDAEFSSAGRIGVRMTGAWPVDTTYPINYIKAYE